MMATRYHELKEKNFISTAAPTLNWNIQTITSIHGKTRALFSTCVDDSRRNFVERNRHRHVLDLCKRVSIIIHSKNNDLHRTAIRTAKSAIKLY